ncbi:hypothetical protein [Microbacterium sp. 77mftsu3.1]|uniref:hypothetical protein n=1 Tax=Microbacterium sp. 77mftsu3.1 TaxID=1761802 RepID=UPI0003642F60|nr:hypothetical protein [Microbacterium sp. 77mftsu3.1]SDH31617.1 hypothetical protein SAMN04488590_3007 [Microbacterium sp. 77mftsu3.1]
MTNTSNAHTDRIRTTATLSRGEFGPYSVSNIKKMNGREGEAYSATIKRGRTAIADIHQDGNGGETFVSPASREAREELEAYVAEHWDFDLTYGGNYPSSTPHDVASFADALFSEFDLRRTLARAVKAGTLILLADADLAAVEEDDQVLQYTKVTRALDDAAKVYAQFLKQGAVNERTLYWTGTEWAELSKA